MLVARALTKRETADTLAAQEAWEVVALSTERCDRTAAEQAVARAYEVSGLAAPKVIVWMDSPLGGLLAVAAGYLDVPPSRVPAPAWRGFRDLMREGIGDEASARIADQLIERLPEAVWEPLSASARATAGDLIWAPLRATVERRLRLRFGHKGERRLAEHLRAALRLRRWHALPVRPSSSSWLFDYDPRAYLARLGGHPYPPGSRPGLAPWSHAFDLVRYTRALQLGHLREPRLDAVAEVLRNVGWWWPLDGAAVLTDRPIVLRYDRAGRLHAADGPALAYADGDAWYRWRGKPVPADLVAGEGWGLQRILAEPDADVQRCAIERRGWDRFATEAGLAQVGPAQPDPGNPGQVLRLYELPRQLRKIYRLRARILVVTNARPDRDGSRRPVGIPLPAEVTDAVGAAAWTFRVRRREYLSLERAT